MAKASGYFTTVSERKQLDPAPVEDWFRATVRTVQADFLCELERITMHYQSMRAAWDHAPNSSDLRKWLEDFSDHAKALADLLGGLSDTQATGTRIVSIALGDIIGSGKLHASLLSAANDCDHTINQLSANRRGAMQTLHGTTSSVT
jgi:hypothetical protein